MPTAQSPLWTLIGVTFFGAILVIAATAHGESRRVLSPAEARAVVAAASAEAARLGAPEGAIAVVDDGGLWVLAPDGRHLGTIRAPRLPANFAFGDDDGKSLYRTARTTLYRPPLLVEGVRPGPSPSASSASSSGVPMQPEGARMPR